MAVRTLIGGLVVASMVVLVPAGLAAQRPDDRAGPIGVGSIVQPATVRPDDRAARFTPGMIASAPTLPDNRADRFTPGATTQPVTGTTTADTGIDWNDPRIVAVSTVLVAGLATAAAFAAVHHRSGGPGTRGTPGTPTPTH
jgi:hypothetical protein